MLSCVKLVIFEVEMVTGLTTGAAVVALAGADSVSPAEFQLETS